MPYNRKHMKTITVALLLLCCSIAFPYDKYRDFPPELVGYDVSRHVHVYTEHAADSVRQSIIDYFWNSRGIPYMELPAAEYVFETGDEALPDDLDGLDMQWIDAVRRLDVEVDYDYHHYSYLIIPVPLDNANRLVIVHQGHQGGLKDGVATITNHLLERGFPIVLSQMPLVGWNKDNTWVLPESTFTPNRSGAAGHDVFVPRLEGIGGSSLRYFIEPIIVCINYFLDRRPGCTDVSMIGLSGGGWTTHLVSAVDTRVNLSVPVAGSYPLYLRPYYSGSAGDAEQILPELYEQRASWLDLYILGGAGQSRKQMQILNQFDNCCFYGVGSRSYDSTINATVANMPAGEWSCLIDSTHRSHRISPWSVARIDEALEYMWNTYINPLAVVYDFSIHDNRRATRPAVMRPVSHRSLRNRIYLANGRAVGFAAIRKSLSLNQKAAYLVTSGGPVNRYAGRR